ncbi:hypothetical protein [Ectobacillus funiculus]|uniref:HTH merR-type domain-containing protein n=1 Tax=Ectobacillus funiculus TaxID=137993 RepID=A0ABV5WF78_9BACI
MENVTNYSEKLYWTREVADILDIKEGTVRKYARMLEDQGHSFLRNEHDQRGFLEKDVIMFKQLIVLSKTKGITLEDAVNTVISRNKAIPVKPVTPPVIPNIEELERYNERHKEVLSTLLSLRNENEELRNVVKELSARIDLQQKVFQECFLKQEEQLTQTFQQVQDMQQLMTNSLQQVQETHQLIAASTEEKKKGFLAKLFGT